MIQTIGQVAEKVGVSPQTLRRWEIEGFIPVAKRKFINRWRVWTEEDIQTIEQFVKHRSKE